MIDTNNKAINFKLNDTDGKEISKNKFNEKRIVLYFYLKDNTLGCTIEAN